MTIKHPDGDPSITQLPGQEDLVAVSQTTGAAYVPVDEDADEDRDFVQTPGRGKAVFALGTSQAIDNSEGGISKTFFPQIMVAFGVGNAGLGLMNALGMYARMLFGPIWAMAADRFGRKKILFIVTGLWGLWTVATGFAQSWNQLLVLYGISLVGTVASEPIVNGLLGSLYKKSERGKAFGAIRGTSALLGMAITPLIGQLGDNPNGWRYAMMIMGVLSVVSGILILLFVKEPEKAEKITDDPDAGLFKLSDAAKLFKIPTITAVACMLPLVTSMVLFGFMGKYWAVELGYGVKNSAYLYTVFQAGSMLSAFLGGFLADFFVRKLGHKGRIVLFQLYAAVFSLMTFLAFQVQWGRGIYYLVVFLLGLIFSIGFSGCVLPMVSSVCPKQLSATSFAVLFSLIQGFLTATISLFVGNIADSGLGLKQTLFYFVTIPYAINAVYWFIFYKIYPKDVAKQAERTRLIEQGAF